MSFGVTQLFQTSSDHAKDGAFAVGIIYIVFCSSNLALSSHLNHLLGVRLTLVLSSLTYVFFIAANIKYYPWMLYTSAFLLGLGAALLWTAQGVYVTLATNEHEQVNGLASSSTRGLINGIFLGLFYLHQTLGNLLMSLLFYSKLSQWIIFTIMTAIAGLGTFSLMCLRPMKMPKNTDQRSVLSRLTILCDLPFVLLVPSISYLGLAQGFIYAAIPPLIIDNSRKFLIFAFYGIVTAVCSIVFGRLSDSRIRRLDVFILGAFSHTVIYALLLTKWKPPLDQNRIEIFIIIVAGLAVGDSLFTSQIFSTLAVFYGFTRPADAFASLRLFQSAGTALIYVTQAYISLRIQLVGLIVLASLAVVTLIYEHYGVKSLDTGKTNMEVQRPSSTLSDMKIDDGLPLNISTNTTVL
ncbi:unnamed protein product [Adineta ricciae]|uniref:Uncharacterized protein n=1 Tax=Adineta ricciae TaxID=249248 RepID=A0A814UM55_ADIRI|nr:unnamed protein product [Adineta ricciae]